MAKTRYITSEDGLMVLQKINELLNLKRGYQPNTKRTSELEARLKEYHWTEICDVLEYIFKKWSTWSERDRYFNPTTLFRKSNFERYIEDMQIDSEKDNQSGLEETEKTKTVKTLQDYIKAVLERSGYSKAHYLRLSLDGKAKINEYLKKQYENGISPTETSIIGLLQEVA